MTATASFILLLIQLCQPVPYQGATQANQLSYQFECRKFVSPCALNSKGKDLMIEAIACHQVFIQSLSKSLRENGM